MNVAKRTARRSHAKPLARETTKVEERIERLLSGSRDVILTKHQVKARASNPNAKIGLSKKAAKKLQRRVLAMRELSRESQSDMQLE